jgi:phage virion morphogenesis protein
MSGFSYTVRIEDQDMRAELARLVERMENRAGFFKNVGEHLLNSTAENFANERAPDGSPWQRLSPMTVESRLRRHGNAALTILRVSGALAGSINYIASSDDVRVGTAKVYGAIHQFGGKAGRGAKVSMPARPYVGVSAEDEAAIMEIAEDWLSEHP